VFLFEFLKVHGTTNPTLREVFISLSTVQVSRVFSALEKQEMSYSIAFKTSRRMVCRREILVPLKLARYIKGLFCLNFSETEAVGTSETKYCDYVYRYEVC
jgi:hypothetical protein